MDKDWLTVEEIANDLRVHVSTVRDWIKQRKLKAGKFGRDYRIRREDYQKFIHEHLFPDTEENTR